METLQQVKQYLYSIPRIHEGGCGYAAYAVYLWLKNRGELEDFQIIFVHYTADEISTEEYNNNCMVLEGERVEVEAPRHVVFRYRERIQDCKEYMDAYYFQIYSPIYIPQEQTEAFMKSAFTYGYWNEKFNKKHLKKIENKLNIVL